MNRGIASTVSLATALLACLSGCGVDSSGTPAAIEVDYSSRPSRAEFIREASEICHRGKQESLERARVSELPLQAEAVRIILPIYQRTVNEVARLEFPLGDYERLTVAIEELQREIHQSGGRFRSPEQFQDLFRSSGRKFRAYGLSACDFQLAGSHT